MQHKCDISQKYTILALSGAIDENADFRNLPVVENQFLVIDLNLVTHINSMGVRNWILWMTSLNHIQSILLRRVPAIIVNQMNVLDGFKPMAAIVESLYVPYHCHDCDQTTYLLAERGRDYREAYADSPAYVRIPAQRPCQRCGRECDADLIEAKFFRFLGRREVDSPGNR
jgi:hypothetical protein